MRIGCDADVAARDGRPEQHTLSGRAHVVRAGRFTTGHGEHLNPAGDLDLVRAEIQNTERTGERVVAAEHGERSVGDIERREAGRAGVLGADWFDAGLGGDKGCRAEARQQNGGNDA